MKPVLVAPSGLSRRHQQFSRWEGVLVSKCWSRAALLGVLVLPGRTPSGEVPLLPLRMDASLPPSWYHSARTQCERLPAPHSHPSPLPPPLPRKPSWPLKLMPSRSSHPTSFPVAINTDSPSHCLSLLRHLSARSLFPAPPLPWLSVVLTPTGRAFQSLSVSYSK